MSRGGTETFSSYLRNPDTRWAPFDSPRLVLKRRRTSTVWTPQTHTQLHKRSFPDHPGSKHTASTDDKLLDTFLKLTPTLGQTVRLLYQHQHNSFSLPTMSKFAIELFFSSVQILSCRLPVCKISSYSTGASFAYIPVPGDVQEQYGL